MFCLCIVFCALGVFRGELLLLIHPSQQPRDITQHVYSLGGDGGLRGLQEQTEEEVWRNPVSTR